MKWIFLSYLHFPNTEVFIADFSASTWKETQQIAESVGLVSLRDQYGEHVFVGATNSQKFRLEKELQERGFEVVVTRLKPWLNELERACELEIEELAEAAYEDGETDFLVRFWSEFDEVGGSH